MTVLKVVSPIVRFSSYQAPVEVGAVLESLKGGDFFVVRNDRLPGISAQARQTYVEIDEGLLEPAQGGE